MGNLERIIPHLFFPILQIILLVEKNTFHSLNHTPQQQNNEKRESNN
jgi:hypothetical protein